MLKLTKIMLNNYTRNCSMISHNSIKSTAKKHNSATISSITIFSTGKEPILTHHNLQGRSPVLIKVQNPSDSSNNQMNSKVFSFTSLTPLEGRVSHHLNTPLKNI